MQEQRADERPWHLRRRDQAVVGAVVILSLSTLAASWWLRGGFSGGLVEYDDLPSRKYQFRLDLNTAEWTELALLPGIGNTLAQRIVATREANGPFQSLEELGRVRGIGDKTLEAIRPHLSPMPADR